MGGGGTRSQVWGGGTPSQVRGGYHISGPGGGTPSQVPWGVPVVPPPPGIASTCYCYAAGGMPLAFKQEDFLVVLEISGCLVFVCLSLLEAAFVSYISKWSEQTDRREGSFSYPSWNSNDKIMNVELNKPSSKCGPKVRTERIHKICRVIFPILFLFFNIGYFLYYFCM